MVKVDYCNIEKHDFSETCATCEVSSEKEYHKQCSVCGAVPCHDCDEIVVWVEEKGWWYHQNPDAKECYLCDSLEKEVE